MELSHAKFPTHPTQSKALLPWNLPQIPHHQPQFKSEFLLLVSCWDAPCSPWCTTATPHPAPPQCSGSINTVLSDESVFLMVLDAWASADGIQLSRTCSRNTKLVIQILVNQRMLQKTLGNLWIPVSPVDLVSSFLKEAETLYFFFLLVKDQGGEQYSQPWLHFGTTWVAFENIDTRIPTPEILV